MDQKNEKLHREFNDILTEFNKHNIKDNDVVYFTLQRLYKNLDDRVMAQKKVGESNLVVCDILNQHKEKINELQSKIDILENRILINKIIKNDK